MYARSTEINAQRSAIEPGIEHIKSKMVRAALDARGCVGLSLLVNRRASRCIVTTSWDSEATMRSGDRSLRETNYEAVQAFGGTRGNVDEWEIAVLHREHNMAPGGCVRCTWMQTNPQLLDHATETFKTFTLPQLELFEGFSSASMFVNRDSGMAVVSSAWDSHLAMAESREPAQQLRSATVYQVRGHITDVAEFQLEVAHLRVPELV